MGYSPWGGKESDMTEGLMLRVATESEFETEDQRCGGQLKIGFQKGGLNKGRVFQKIHCKD